MAATGQRVIVGVDGSQGSVQALLAATAEARRLNAELHAVCAWTPPGGEVAELRARSPRELHRVWEDAAAARLDHTFAQAFGGIPADLAVERSIIRGAAGPALVHLADRPDDILVVGTGAQDVRGALRRFATGGSVTRHCLAKARCNVHAVPQGARYPEPGRPAPARPAGGHLRAA
jgi:nucleotide-binding universal stress UspA family protein